MKKFKFITACIACVLCLAFVFTGCNNNGNKTNFSDGNILIAFFSRADENYGVGTVEKGNTHILAEMIQEEVGGDLFHIQRSTPYPAVYSDCTAEAQREKNADARPELLQTKDIPEYDIIFIGYPIWWSDMPMPVYTFFESQNWNGKTVIPFSTNEGSGLAGTVNTVKSKCTGATVLNALSMRGLRHRITERRQKKKYRLGLQN